MLRGEKVTSDGNPVDEIAEGSAGKESGEGFLAAENDFYGEVRVGRRAHKEAKICQRLGIDEVGLVNDEYRREVRILGAIEDLKEEIVLAPPWDFSEPSHDEAKQGARRDSRKVKINGSVTVLGETFHEAPEQGGFPDACLADHKGDGALLREVLEPWPKPGRCAHRPVSNPWEDVPERDGRSF